jgi:hypothetical protein
MPKSSGSTSTPKYRARQSSISHLINATPMRKRRVFQLNKPVPYVRGLGTRERVDMVLSELFEKHRWSIKDFIRHLVTAEPVKKNGVRSLVRAKTLSDAIYQQKEVVEQLSRVSKDIRHLDNMELITRLRAELDAVGRPEIGLGMFESTKDISELDIPNLADRVQSAAPELWGLLAGLMEPQRASNRDTLTTHKGSMVMICSILAHARAPRKCNNLPMLLGLHLHSMGVKRRTISVLAGLGVISSYWTINAKYDELIENGKVLRIYSLSFQNAHHQQLILTYIETDCRSRTSPSP